MEQIDYTLDVIAMPGYLDEAIRDARDAKRRGEYDAAVRILRGCDMTDKEILKTIGPPTSQQQISETVEKRPLRVWWDAHKVSVGIIATIIGTVVGLLAYLHQVCK